MEQTLHQQLVNLSQNITYNRIRYISTILVETKEHFPEHKVNEQELSAWLHRFLDAVTSDLLEGTDVNIKSVLLDYLHTFKKVRYNPNKSHLVYALHILRNIIIENVHDEELISEIIFQFSSISDLLENRSITEAHFWNFLAFTAPYIVIISLIVDHYFTNNTFEVLIFKLIVVVFFSTAVIWWWWAMSKLIILTVSFTYFKVSFTEIKNKLIKVREDLK